MKLEWRGDYLFISRDVFDVKFRSDSRLLSVVRDELKKQGHDVIKKRMVKDHHMVDDQEFYIRDRDRTWCLINDRYAITALWTEFAEIGTCHLTKIDLQPQNLVEAIQRDFL